jgi:hypothetical protein
MRRTSVYSVARLRPPVPCPENEKREEISLPCAFPPADASFARTVRESERSATACVSTMLCHDEHNMSIHHVQIDTREIAGIEA